MKSGVEIIAEKRQKQITKHGYITTWDVNNNQEGELVDAAMQYLGGTDISCWPDKWSKESYNPSPGDRIEELANAGALIAAEIDRLNSQK